MIKTYVELPDAIEPGEKIIPPYQHAFKYEPKHDKEKGFIYLYKYSWSFTRGNENKRTK